MVFMSDVLKQTGATMAYSVIVADDHALVRQGVKGAIEAGEDFEVAAEAADGIQAIIQVKKHRPDLLVLDIAMPHSNGIE
jgi:two-component system, NarL family, response regulator DegU